MQRSGREEAIDIYFTFWDGGIILGNFQKLSSPQNFFQEFDMIDEGRTHVSQSREYSRFCPKLLDKPGTMGGGTILVVIGIPNNNRFTTLDVSHIKLMLQERVCCAHIKPTLSRAGLYTRGEMHSGG